jgi:succinate dehydrogenase / fumarate reductase cytochrome b subunit
MANSLPKRARPLSPNIQIYRPQLTSVLSIANRLTGVVLSLYAVALVVWLIAAAAGPQAYAMLHLASQSPVGQLFLLVATYSLFLHLCGGVRHLMWDAGYGFELAAIYASGWIVVAMSAALTAAAWIAGRLMTG